ncbi:MAG: hypothetical protein J0I24_00235 [Thiomonas arsenitoxydans]|uniref:Glycosyltransferase n=1 Tax=Thiomonas arsenitoxydans (strain DSM 22701 / CIP 110005 / 3As) TaxID=426114 RepID=A0A8I1MVB7_THIA3|nr:hypothetical protein [Thiomonas arsenitoxydans]MBN8742712.1 hypothetical protein [Thiomonas arsenitoxydans]
MKKLSIPIVSDVPPDPVYTGGQVLHRIISSMPDVRFEFFWVNHLGLPGHIAVPENGVIARVFSFQLRGIWLWISRLTRRLGERSTLLRRIGLVVRMLMGMAKTTLIGVRLGLNLRNSPSRVVWFVVQGEKTVLCYTVAAWLSGKKFIIHQWDPLAWWMTHRGHPRQLHRLMRKLLDRLERRAVLNLVPSDAWKARLTGEGKRCIRIDNFFDDPVDDQRDLVLLTDPKSVHAVFIGQFYANAELESLLNLLSRTLQAMGKSLVVHFFGYGSPPQVNPGYQFVAHGALPRDELVTRIAKWDLALLPYPMEERFIETSTLSFPSKSRVYLAAGLPIMSWARDGASPDVFYREHYGHHYHNGASADGTEAFIWSVVEASPKYRRQRHATAQKILGEQFSYTSELVPFRNFLVQHV